MTSGAIKGRLSGGTGDPQDLTSSQVRSIINVEDGSTADQTNAEIQTAYNAQVPEATQAEAEAGTSTSTRRFTVERVKQSILALSPFKTNAEVKAGYEANANTNAFTDSEESKLSAIEAGATTDQTDAEIETAYNNQVPLITQAEIEAGTDTNPKRFTAERVKQAIAVLASGDNISIADLTFDANHYVNLVTYDWEVKKGSDTYFKIPSNGKMRMTSPNASVNDYILTIDQRLGGYGLGILQGTNDAGFNVAGSNNSIIHTYNHNNLDRVNFGSNSNTGNYMVNVIDGGIDFGGGRMVNMISQSTGSSFAGVTLGYKAGSLPMGVLTGYTRGIEMYLSASVIHTFNVDGTTILKGTAAIGSEKISLQDDTLIKGSDNSVNTSGFKFTDINNNLLLDIRNNGQTGWGGNKVINVAHAFYNSGGGSSSLARFYETDGTIGINLKTNGTIETKNSSQGTVFSTFAIGGVPHIQLYHQGRGNIIDLQSGASHIDATSLVVGGQTGITGAKFVIQNASTNTYQQLFFANVRTTTLGFINSSGSYGTDQKGLEGYDTDKNKKFFWNGTAWEKIKGNIESVSVASATTITPNIDTSEMEIVSALASALTIAVPTGVASSFYEGKELTFRIKDNGNAYGLTWNAIFVDYTGALPTTTVAGKTVYIGCKYNVVDTKWDVVAVQVQP